MSLARPPIASHRAGASRLDTAGRPASVWQAMRSPRFLVTPWAWRAIAYVTTSTLVFLLGAIPLSMAFAPLITLVDSGRQRSIVGFLLALVVSLAAAAALLTVAAAPITRLDVARARLVDAQGLPVPMEPADLLERWRRRLTERAGWLRVLYVLLTYTVGAAGLLMVLAVAILAGTLLLAPLLVSRQAPISFGAWRVSTMPQAWLAAILALLPLAGTPYLCGLLATGQVALGRFLLADPATRLRADLVELTRSRERLVHSFDAERQRIERDLHDGAQQGLVALTVRLGLARMDLESQFGRDHPTTREITEAHDQAKELISQLRAFIYGVHPKILTDLGLAAALDQLAATLPVPVTLHDQLGERPSAYVESTIYFSVAEALTNVVRHSAATRATVTVSRTQGAVVADVWDDGHGGADPRRGTGLSGIADRVAVLHGTVWVTSPSGGPTLIRVRVPDPREQG